MEMNDEVVSLAREVLRDLQNEGLQDEFSITWKYFLSQTLDFARVLKKRLSRDNWPTIYEGIDGHRILQVSIAGTCPASALSGLIVFLCEEDHFNCDIQCSLRDLKTQRGIFTVLSSICEKGWNVKLKSIDDHFTDMRFDGDRLDLVLIAHPKIENDLWIEGAEFLGQGGCVLVIDRLEAESFAKAEEIGLECAQPIVFDRLPSGIDQFEHSEQSAIQNLKMDEDTVESELPLFDMDSAATLFINPVRLNEPNLVFEPSRNGNVSSAGESHGVFSYKEPKGCMERDVSWKGKWIKRSESGSAPPEFLFASLKTCFDKKAEDHSISFEYYRAEQDNFETSRIRLEGMGRPMLLRHYMQF